VLFRRDDDDRTAYAVYAVMQYVHLQYTVVACSSSQYTVLLYTLYYCILYATEHRGLLVLGTSDVFSRCMTGWTRCPQMLSSMQ